VTGCRGVASIMNKMRKNRLSWFGYVMRREDSEAVKTVMELNMEGRRERERPKKKWLNGIECNMDITGVCVNDVGDQVK